MKITKKDLKLYRDKHLVLCSTCETPASWESSIDMGEIVCSPCVFGEADSFDDSDLIANDKFCIDLFLKEFNK